MHVQTGLPAPACLTCQPYLTVSLACLSPLSACLPCLLVSPTLSALARLTVPSWLSLGHVLRQNTRNLSAFSYQIEVCLGSCLYIEDVQLLLCLPDCLSVCPTVSLPLCACPSIPLSLCLSVRHIDMTNRYDCVLHFATNYGI